MKSAGIKRRKEISYIDRNHHFWYVKPRRKVCPACRVTFAKNKMCPNCGTNLITVSYRAKIPRKTANNRVWKQFWNKHNKWCGSNPYRKKCYGS